jgi:hypothetical protein
MCDFSVRLVPWLDRELAEPEAAGVELHLRTCSECRNSLAAYKELDQAILAYCNATVPAAVHRGFSMWTPVLLAAAAAALLLLFPHGHIDRDRPQLQAAASSPAVLEPAAQRAPHTSVIKSVTTGVRRPVIKSVHLPQVVAPAKTQNAEWIPAQPAIQIAIPAEAMFAPGAVPQGVSFTAELSIAADGSAQQLRLRP